MSKEAIKTIDILKKHNTEEQYRVENELANINIEKKRKIDEINFKIKQDKKIIDNSGIREIFQEIIESGVLNKNDSRLTYYMSESKNTNPSIVYDDMLVYISLFFDVSAESGEGGSEVRISVIDNKLALTKRVFEKNGSKFGEFINEPIEDEKLGETIANAIINPPIKW